MANLQSTLARQDNASRSLSDHLLELACRKAPTLARTLDRFGEVRIGTYLESLPTGTSPSLQPRDDLIDTLYRYALSLLGKSTALRVARDFQQRPVALTANHHGVDFFAQSVQGSLLFGLGGRHADPPVSTIPVFACGNIPLNNLTFPMGLLLYSGDNGGTETMPHKLPIMANRWKRSMVGAAPAFAGANLLRASKRVARMVREEKLSQSFGDCVQKVVNKIYGDPDILSMESYSDQAVVLNYRLWKRLFAKPGIMPDLIYLEVEKIAADLLRQDLLNRDSLAWSVMFDPLLRQTLIEELDGYRLCWKQADLISRAESAGQGGAPPGDINGSGTIFFWGIDDAARKVPLCLRETRRGHFRLQGVDDRGEARDIAFTPKSIIKELNESRIIPSLFTTYLTLAFARSVVCVGGYYQASYLPDMQRGLLRALEKSSGYDHMVQAVRKVPADTYLSGMQTVMAEFKPGHLTPAGPLEIIGAGGLDARDLDKIRSLTVRESHLSSLAETLPDLAPGDLPENGWKTMWARECGRSLGDKLVIKQLRSDRLQPGQDA